MGPLREKSKDFFRTTREKGNEAEELAGAFLRRQRFVVVERNFVCRAGEIDIVARDGETLVFVEVRSRADGSFLDPILSVTPDKMEKIVRAAEWYLQARRVPPSTPCRFDVVGITGPQAGARLVLIKNAFTLNDLPSRRGRGRRGT